MSSAQEEKISHDSAKQLSTILHFWHIKKNQADRQTRQYHQILKNE